MVVLQPPSVSFVERSRLGSRQRSPCGRLYGARAGRILSFQPRSLRAPEQFSTSLPAPFWALPPLCAPAQGGGLGATGLRGQVRCDTSLLCCCGLYLHSDASQIRLASSLRASWLGFRSPLQAVFSFCRACSGHFTQAPLHRTHVRLMVCYQASTEMRAGSDSQRASTGSGFSCHVFQAFPGEACSERTLLGGAAGGCLRAAPIPRGLLFLKKRKKKDSEVHQQRDLVELRSRHF